MLLSEPGPCKSNGAGSARTLRPASAEAPLSMGYIVTQIAWVKGLPEAQAREAVAAARVRHYSAGSIVTMAGDDACLITILVGSVFFEAGYSAYDIGPSDWQIAPSNFLTGASLAAGSSIMTITASSDIVVARWPGHFILDRDDHNPYFTHALSGILGAMASRAMQSAVDMHLPTAERRCAAIVLRLSENTSALDVTRETLGQMANVSRSGSGSILLSFARAGIVELDYRKVIVRDRAALAAIREGTTRHPQAKLQFRKSDGSEPHAAGARWTRSTHADTLHAPIQMEAVVR